MKLLITGAGGLLGSDLARTALARSHDVTAPLRSDLDVTDPQAVRSVVASARPDVIIHCAAYSDVDGAEEHPELAMLVNRDSTRYLAAAAVEGAARFVYVSSDYVFDGAQASPYAPDAATTPLSVYGRSKLAGEEVCRDLVGGALVARTGWLYGGSRANFVTSMIARAARGEVLRVVDDQVGGPSWTRYVAEGLLDLVAHQVQGTWHVADRGSCSWAELAREAVDLGGLEAEVVGVSSAAWGAMAARPPYSVLDVTATERLLGQDRPHWRAALSRFVTEGH